MSSIAQQAVPNSRYQAEFFRPQLRRSSTLVRRMPLFSIEVDISGSPDRSILLRKKVHRVDENRRFSSVWLRSGELSRPAAQASSVSSVYSTKPFGAPPS